MATAKEMCNTSPPLWDLESERVLRIQLFSIEPILGTYLSSGVGMKLILGGGASVATCWHILVDLLTIKFMHEVIKLRHDFSHTLVISNCQKLPRFLNLGITKCCCVHLHEAKKL